MSLVSDATIYLIVAVVLAVIILGFVGNLYGGSFVDEAPCTSTGILATFQQRVAGITTFESPESSSDRSEFCPPVHMTVSERTSDKAALRAIAQQMALCHRNYGAGDLNLFSHERSEKNLYCVVCGYVDFDDNDVGEIEGLNEYLATEYVPGKDITYADYLGSPDPSLHGDAVLPEYNISRDTDYGILYFYGERNEFWASKVEAVSTLGAAGAGTGAVVGVVAVIAAPVSAGTTLMLLIPSAAAGLAVGGSAGVAGGAASPAGADYVGATVIAPWDAAVFGENNLKCDRIEGLP